MTPVEILSLCATGISVVAIILSAVDKMPFVQNNKTLKTWIDDANDIAGQLKLIVPMGSTVSQVEALADAKAAAVVEKYAGGVTQAEVVTQVMGEFARIVQSGHVIPAALVPAENVLLAAIAKLQATVEAQAPAATPVEPTPAAVPAKPMMSAEMAAFHVSPSAVALAPA